MNIYEHPDQKDHHAQNLLRSQTHALNRFTTAHTANTKIEQIANVHENPCYVHEMFIIYVRETHCPRNEKKLTNS